MGFSRKDYKKAVRSQKRAVARALRKSRIENKDRKKAQQKKSEPANAQKRSDEAISTTKQARKTGSTGQEQSVATPGDIVPIVFGKRGPQASQDNNVVGGVWLQPDKIKQASYNFTGIFLYAISQGEIVSTPSAPTTYIGDLSLTARGGTIPTLTNYYSSVSTMSSAPNVCPITSGKIFCDPDTVSFINHVQTKSGYKNYLPDHYNLYYNEFELTIGSGDTTNTTFEIPGTTLRVWEVQTGDDRTSNYWTAVGLTPATTTFLVNNELTDDDPPEDTGRAVGTIFNFYNIAIGQYEAPTKDDANPAFRAYYTAFGSSAEDEPVAFEYGAGTVNTQTDSSEAATDDTLGGCVTEVHLSAVADPSNFDSSYDFTDYADITFLEIQGNIYDESNALEGQYNTTTRQLSVLIEEGVKVPLYSSGSPGSTGSSHQFVDLAMYLFVINKRLIAGTTADIASPVDTSNLQSLATFNANFGLFFNGIIEQSVNIIDFISTMSPYFFMSFVTENGRYAFKPILPLSGDNIDTGALSPTKTFTDSDIIPGSFEKDYVEAEERKDVQVSIVFRETKKFRVGLQKSTQIRYSDVDADVRMIQYDMTDCCVTGKHARNFAKLQLATRRHSTHSISFDTPLLTSSLSINDIIKVQRVRKNNVGDDRTESDHYQVTSIGHGSDGITTIAAMHFPLNGSNVSKISDDVVNGSFDFI
jgi:hypothetical protein